MPWEACDVPYGTTVYVDGRAYTAVGIRLRAGKWVCPPYLGLTGEQAPSMPAETTSQARGDVWWISHLRVEWDGPELTETVETHQRRVWRRS